MVDVFNNPSNDYADIAAKPCTSGANDNTGYFNISGSDATITKGIVNTETLDLSDINIPVNEWNKETKIINPGSIEYICGLDKGLLQRTQVIPFPEFGYVNQYYFINISFDFNYINNFSNTTININAKSNYVNSLNICDSINKLLIDNNINVNSSIQSIDDNTTSILFKGNLEGFDFSISNLYLSIIDDSIDTNSPFPYNIYNNFKQEYIVDKLLSQPSKKYLYGGLQGYFMKFTYPEDSCKYNSWLYMYEHNDKINYYKNKEAIVDIKNVRNDYNIEFLDSKYYNPPTFDYSNTIAYRNIITDYNFNYDEKKLIVPVLNIDGEVNISGIEEYSYIENKKIINTPALVSNDNIVLDKCSIFNNTINKVDSIKSSSILSSSISNIDYCYKSYTKDSVLDNVNLFDGNSILNSTLNNSYIKNDFNNNIIKESTLVKTIINSTNSISYDSISDTKIIDTLFIGNKFNLYRCDVNSTDDILGINAIDSSINANTVSGNFSNSNITCKKILGDSLKFYGDKLTYNTINDTNIDVYLNKFIYTQFNNSILYTNAGSDIDLGIYKNTASNLQYNNMNYCDVYNRITISDCNINECNVSENCYIENSDIIDSTLKNECLLKSCNLYSSKKNIIDDCFILDSYMSGNNDIDNSIIENSIINSNYLETIWTKPNDDKYPSNGTSDKKYGTIISNSNLKKAVVKNAVLIDCSVYDCYLENCSFRGGYFINTTYDASTFSNKDTEVVLYNPIYTENIIFDKEIDNVYEKETIYFNELSELDYLKNLSDNMLWNKVGKFVSKFNAPDYYTEDCINLISGIYLYNPQNFPIKVESLIMNEKYYE